MYRSLLLSTAATTLCLASPAIGQIADASSAPVETVVVTAQKLAEARNGIQTQIGASTYTITAKDIDNQPGGENTLLNQVVLQAPGVAQDSFGQLHVRGEHNGLQYRLNGIIIPEGISVFGQTLDPRLAEFDETDHRCLAGGIRPPNRRRHRRADQDGIVRTRRRDRHLWW